MNQHTLVRMPRSVRTGAAIGAILGTIGIGAGTFVLSFTALTDLVRTYSLAGDLAWIWAVSLDGLIVVATMALVVLAGERARERVFAMFLLGAGVLLSTVGNVAHALIEGFGLIGSIIAAVPPLLLAAISHLSVHLLRHALTREVPAAHLSGEVSEGAQPDDHMNISWFEEFEENTPDVSEDEASPHIQVVYARPTEEEVDQWIRAVTEAEGEPPTGERIAEQFGCAPATGRRWRNRALECALKQDELELAST